MERFNIKFLAVAICAGDTVKKVGSSLFFINELLQKNSSSSTSDDVLRYILQLTCTLLIFYAMYISRYQAAKDWLMQWLKGENSDEVKLDNELEHRSEPILGKVFIQTITTINFILVLAHAFFGYQQIKKLFTNDDDVDKHLSVLDDILALYSSLASAAIFLSFSYPRVVNNGRELFHKLQNPENHSEIFNLKNLCQTLLASIGILARVPKELYMNSNTLNKTWLLKQLKGKAHRVGTLIGTASSSSCKLLFESGELIKLIRTPTEIVENNPGYLSLGAIATYSILIEGLQSFVAIDKEITEKSPLYNIKFIIAILIALSTTATEFAITSRRTFQNKQNTRFFIEATPLLSQHTSTQSQHENYGALSEIQLV